jgi:hypothetical protein
VRLVGFIIRKFVTMHGHMNIKFGIGLSPCTLILLANYNFSNAQYRMRSPAVVAV